MNKFTNARYLRSQQYRDASNLNARQRLHRLYSTNAVSWFRWVFDQFELSTGSQVLELGCGPGDLWAENLERLPPESRVTLTDFSPGMLSKAAEGLASDDFQFACLDAQHIPFPDGFFDHVIANHMLYHLPDLVRGLQEIRRILRPGGRLYAATNGMRHMQEIHALAEKFLSSNAELRSSTWGRWERSIPAFHLDNAPEMLEHVFVDVRTFRLQNSLEVNQVEPLVDYMLSMTTVPLPPDKKEELEAFIAAEIARQGGTFHITQEAGVLTAFRL